MTYAQLEHERLELDWLRRCARACGLPVARLRPRQTRGLTTSGLAQARALLNPATASLYDAARIWGVPPSNVYYWVKLGKVRTIRAPHQAVRVYLDSCPRRKKAA